MSVNKVIILGRLGQDPDARYTQSGEMICRLNVATSQRWKDKHTGEPREETEWHRVALFGRQAEVASQYLAKGREVYLEGKLKTRKWTDQQGIERYTTEIIADNLTLVGGRNGNDAPPAANPNAAPSAPPAPTPAPAAPQAPRPAPSVPPASKPAPTTPPPDADPWFADDDIPFS